MKYVSLQGEIVHAGIYSVAPGKHCGMSLSVREALRPMHISMVRNFYGSRRNAFNRQD